MAYEKAATSGSISRLSWRLPQSSANFSRGLFSFFWWVLTQGKDLEASDLGWGQGVSNGREVRLRGEDPVRAKEGIKEIVTDKLSLMRRREFV